MNIIPLVLVFVSAALAPTPHLSAQELNRSFAVQPGEAGPGDRVPTPVLQLRIEEAMQSHHRNRTLGNGLVAAGAAAVVGALVSWVDRDRIGMGTAAAGAMIGGMSLVSWGADRHVAARDALRQAQRLRAQIPPAPRR